MVAEGGERVWWYGECSCSALWVHRYDNLNILTQMRDLGRRAEDAFSRGAEVVWTTSRVPLHCTQALSTQLIFPISSFDNHTIVLQ